jgi:hypothetical protein
MLWLRSVHQNSYSERASCVMLWKMRMPCVYRLPLYRSSTFVLRVGRSDWACSIFKRTLKIVQTVKYLLKRMKAAIIWHVKCVNTNSAGFVLLTGELIIPQAIKTVQNSSKNQTFPFRNLTRRNFISIARGTKHLMSHSMPLSSFATVQW